VEVRGVGRALFAAILLAVAGTLNIIYGIGAIAGGDFFAVETLYVAFNATAWGWITLLLGVVQLTAGFSLMSGGVYGRMIGIAAASFGAVGALLAVGGAHPFWALGVFALCLIVLHGLVVYGEPKEASRV
jgi:hypothetical protein